jgi:hypothetical protein
MARSLPSVLVVNANLLGADQAAAKARVIENLLKPGLCHPNNSR